MKALFRRGKYYLALNNFECAEEDLEKAFALEPANQAVIEQRKLLKKKMQDNDSVTASAMAKFFSAAWSYCQYWQVFSGTFHEIAASQCNNEGSSSLLRIFNIKSQALNYLINWCYFIDKLIENQNKNQLLSARYSIEIERLEMRQELYYNWLARVEVLLIFIDKWLKPKPNYIIKANEK